MEIINENYNEYTIDYLDLELIKNCCNCNEVRCIDEIIVNHITPKENQELLMSEDIMTLPKALTTDTALSRYLKDKKFEFKFVDNQIIAKRNGKVVDWNKLKQSNLFVRFGGLKSLANAYGDFSIADDYAEKCRNYFVSFKVPLDMADIECTNVFIDKQRKSDLLVRYSINAMAHCLKAGAELSKKKMVIGNAKFTKDGQLES